MQVEFHFRLQWTPKGSTSSADVRKESSEITLTSIFRKLSHAKKFDEAAVGWTKWKRRELFIFDGKFPMNSCSGASMDREFLTLNRILRRIEKFSIVRRA